MADPVYPEADLEALRDLYARHCLHRSAEFLALFRAAGLQLPDEVARRFAVHRMSHTRAYHSWRAMIDRCTNPKNANFHLYGGRGIKVCRRWRVFANFYDDMGERPLRKTLDRINPNGHYEPENCRWADATTQATNKRRTARTNIEAGAVRYAEMIEKATVSRPGA